MSLRRHYLFATKPWLLKIVAGAMLLGAPVLAAGELPTGVETGPVQFDAILELNAPLLRTHVLLFARYWVAPDYFTLAIVWAEPHVSSLNFATYPVTLIVRSDEKEFRVSNQIIKGIDATFAKPVGPRGVFRYMFNDYPVANLRFAEAEARGNWLYADDFSDANEFCGEQVLALRSTDDSPHPGRSVAQVRVKRDAGRVRTLDLFDNEGRLIKSIEYAYVESGTGQRLRHQKVVLAEMPVTVGFPGGGLHVTVNDEKRTYSELPGTYRQGSRECLVDYGLMQVAGRQALLPSGISVRAEKGGPVLCRALLSDFRPGAPDKGQANQAAEAFAQFSPEGLQCRELLIKYWRKDPAEVAPADVNALRELRTFFHDKQARPGALGEELRRVNMLLQVHWMTGDRAGLAETFQNYLDLLKARDLKRMILEGGYNVVQTTMLWGHFPAADALAAKWVREVMATNDPDSVLDFAGTMHQKGQSWVLIKLMDDLMERYADAPSLCFEGQAARCLSFQKLSEQMREPEKLKRERDIMHIGWVSHSMSNQGLLSAFQSSLANTKELFERLPSPTEAQKILMTRLEEIGQVQSGEKKAEPPGGQ
jgi:hypothetical protein